MSIASTYLAAFVPTTEDVAAVRRPGLFSRAFRAVQEARLRQAERQVARFVERNGSRMTDQMERAIERHFV